MKIAIVFDGLQIGGIERVGADYARILSELGHDVTVVNLVPNLKEMEKEFPKDCKFHISTVQQGHTYLLLRCVLD